jgi:tetratricopeptide (TPR) repeat protein
MTYSTICPRGHRIERTDATDPPLAPTECPICGSALTWSAPTVGLSAPSDPAHAAPGTAAVTVPGYSVVRELGRGGMGVVYLAQQESLRRDVALKVILDGGHAGPEATARFRSEAEAIARLHHPHIIQIYDIGVHEGRPFFSLEWCRGGSLAGRLQGTPLRAKEAAALVEQLARAVHAAHAQGIVHRDLKPGNVLFAEDGSPRISDFGLAKQMGAEGQTATGSVVGTPSYMAPEQAVGKRSTPAVDVYALGAILYECLTGRPPFRAATAVETLRQVTDVEPVPPSRLTPGLARDLETIALKCLHKDPGRRYVTAAALAGDLRRYLDGQPIAARPIGGLERGWRWCLRNRALTAALAGIVLSLLAGTAVALALAVFALVQAHRAEQNARTIAEEQVKTRNALETEARRRRQLRLALDTLTGDIVSELLSRQEKLEEHHKKFLDKVVLLQQEFADDVGDDAESLESAALGQHSIGMIQQRLGRLPEAERAYREALRLRQRLREIGPDRAGNRKREGITWNNLGNVLGAMGHEADAAEAFRNGIALADPPEDKNVPLGPLRIRMNQALQAEMNDRLDEAINGYRAVLAELAPLEAQPAIAADVLELLAQCRSNLGSALISHRQPRPAAAELERSITHFKLLHKLVPAEPRHRSGLAKAVHNLGSALDASGDLAGAAARFQEAVQLESDLVDAYPAIPNYQADLALHLDRLGTVQRRLNQPKEAEANYRRALGPAALAAKDRPHSLDWRLQEADVAENLATLLAELNRFDEAIPAQREVLARRAAIVKDFAGHLPSRLRAAGAGNNLTRMLLEAGQPEEALTVANESIAALAKLNAPRLQAQALAGRAWAEVSLRRFDAALADCERAAQIKDSSQQAVLSFCRACCDARRGRAPAAAATVDGLAKGLPPALRLDAALVYALAADVSDEAAQRDARARQAVDMLRLALAAPALRAADRRMAVLQNDELKSLRERQDFKDLHAQ